MIQKSRKLRTPLIIFSCLMLFTNLLSLIGLIINIAYYDQTYMYSSMSIQLIAQIVVIIANILLIVFSTKDNSFSQWKIGFIFLLVGYGISAIVLALWTFIYHDEFKEIFCAFFMFVRNLFIILPCTVFILHMNQNKTAQKQKIYVPLIFSAIYFVFQIISYFSDSIFEWIGIYWLWFDSDYDIRPTRIISMTSTIFPALFMLLFIIFFCMWLNEKGTEEMLGQTTVEASSTIYPSQQSPVYTPPQNPGYTQPQSPVFSPVHIQNTPALVCKHCGAALSATQKFCSSCGKKAIDICECGYIFRQEAFCPDCGKKRPNQEDNNLE